MKFGIFRSSDTHCRKPPHPAATMLFPYREDDDDVIIEDRGIYAIDFDSIERMLATIGERMVIHKKIDVLATFYFIDTEDKRWPDEIEWVIEIYDGYRE